jgi:hypothetical protein
VAVAGTDSRLSGRGLLLVLVKELDRRLGTWAEGSWRSGRTEGPWLVERTVRLTALVAGFGAATLALTHLLDFGLFGFSIHALNADADSSLWGWAGVAAETAAGVGAVQLALLSKGRWRSLAVLAVLVIFLSSDDFLLLHERASNLGELLPVPHAGRFVWPVLFAPLLGTVAVLLWRLSGDAPGGGKGLLRVGLAGLVVALGLEMGSPVLFALGFEHHTWPYEIEVAIEEALEFGSWLLIAGGLYGLVFHVSES